jgi:hypothetical protein
MVAGIFNIVIGSFCVLSALIIGFGLLLFLPVGRNVMGNVQVPAGLSVFTIIFITIPFIILGALSIVGGVYNLQRRMWGWALAGSITTAIISTMFGVASIVLTAISKDEFAR